MPSVRDIAGRFISGAAAAYAESGTVWRALDSSNVAAAGWNETTGVMSIRFHNGSVYEYPNAGIDTFNALCAAPSPGKFVYYFIRSRYAAERVA